MDFRVLQYFVTIVQTKSISNAAKALHLTQPTLSRQIRDLEDSLGAKLFDRGSREIHLTDDGQYLYNRAIEILSLVEKTESNIRKTPELKGEIYIGAAESQSLDLLARAIKKLLQAYPKVKIHLRSGNADDILEQLNQGVYDLAVTIGKVDLRKYQALPLPNRDRWGILVPAQHPLTQLQDLTLQDVLAYPLIVSSQSTIDPELFAGLGDYRIVATYNLLYNASLLVKAGVGLAICLDGIIDTSYDRSQLQFLPFTGENPDSLQILWKRQSQLSPSAQMLLKIIQTELAKNTD